MKKIKTIFHFITLLVLSAWVLTGFAADKPYQNSVITLTIPDTWHISEEDPNADYGSITLEQGKFFGSGLVTITWSDNRVYEAENAETLQTWANYALESWFFTNPQMSEPTISTYGAFTANRLNAKLQIFFQPFEAIFYNFVAQQHSVSIMQFGATEDKKINQKGFERIQQSLRMVEIPPKN
ncbi:MAG: hypothetical protein CR963_00275 [Gammaproteobacteria bacterium]|nr:MAG: hypothetical protein CR963_00275 [Gammaproteobacteria bacterium]